MKNFTIHTMGCKSNQFETSIIKENLKKDGYTEVSNVEDADFYILNSCSVTHKSDNEAFYLLRNAKHKNPNITNILTGCIAQIEKAKLLEYDFIDIVAGNDEKFNISEIIVSDKKLAASDIMEKTDFTYTHISDTTKTRASLKIQDGCNNRCSYCIIPFARGNSRSAKSEFIIDEINNLVLKGFKEVVFTGIHIGLWGNEFGKNLIDLLKEVEEKTSLKRYRLGSLYPNEINAELLNFLVESEKFCPHFHLSLQSACDKTLKSMNRHYTAADAMNLITEINNRFDLPFIGSDVITGFAGETDADFEITRRNLESAGLSQIHTFPYSVRKGTAGANYPNQVDEKIKEDRANIVKAISKSKFSCFVSKNVGMTKEVLIEKNPDKNSGNLKGVTENYLTVNIDSTDKSLLNTIAMVKITEYKDGKIYGVLV